MDKHLRILAEEGANGLELSASMIWDEPTNVSIKELEQFKKKINGYGLAICSIHSLTYTRPDLKIFDSSENRNALINYIVQMADAASVLGSPHMVFGSAQSRNYGDRNRKDCYSILVETFQRIAEKTAKKGVMILIEPLSRIKTDSIVNTDEGALLVKEVAHDAFGLHIDLKSSFYENEDQQRIWREYGSTIHHCHVSNPGMQPPSSECLHHDVAADAMRCNQYSGYISIEMGRRYGDTVTNLRNSLNFIKKKYLS